MSRPSKLTQETQASLVGMLQRGAYLSHAAGALGVDRRTISTWIRKGREDKEAGRESKFTALADAVDLARARGALAMTEVVTRAAKRDWKAAAWYLERVHPDEFGPVKDFTVRHGGHLTVLTKDDVEDLSQLTDEELDMVETNLGKAIAIVDRASSRSED